LHKEAVTSPRIQKELQQRSMITHVIKVDKRA